MNILFISIKKESILDKALKENLPVPFACKGGVCCTCKAQVMEGEVFMEKKLFAYRRRSRKRFCINLSVSPNYQYCDAEL